MPRIGSILLKRIHQHFGSLQSAWQASASDLAAVEGLGSQTIAGIIKARSQLDPEAYLSQHSLKNPHFWTPADRHYPPLLWEIPDPPPVLYYRGQCHNWSQDLAIAIIGTRHPSPYGRKWAKLIAQALAQQGFIVISGLAEGIDGEAHQSCLATGGKTIAVVGTSVDQVYPPKHQQLYQEISKTGLIISEYPSGTEIQKSHFPQRNRIIAGLCRASIVIEAPSKSGALITAHQANDYGRDVYALPGSLDTEQAIGCLQLINRGAQLILGIDELLESLGAMPNLNPRSPDLPTQPDQQKIIDLLSFTDLTSFDQVVAASGLPSGEIAAALLELELMGAIAQVAGMRYQRLI